MNNTLNIFILVVIIALTIFTIRVPAFFVYMILRFNQDIFYAIFPFIVCLSYGLIVYFSLKQLKNIILAVLILGIPLITLSIIGQVIKFTSLDSSGPGVWEWIEMISPYTTVLIIALVIFKHYKFNNKITEQSH